MYYVTICYPHPSPMSRSVTQGYLKIHTLIGARRNIWRVPYIPKLNNLHAKVNINKQNHVFFPLKYETSKMQPYPNDSLRQKTSHHLVTQNGTSQSLTHDTF